jgi:hypothetical protein
LANAGHTVLLIGDFPELASPNYPNVVEAEKRGVVLAECVRGINHGLDLLPTGTDAMSFHRLGGWRTLEGRYEFILHAVIPTAGEPGDNRS